MNINWFDCIDQLDISVWSKDVEESIDKIREIYWLYFEAILYDTDIVYIEDGKNGYIIDYTQ